MDIKEQVTKMDSMIAKGAIVEAVKEFFAQDARTSDYNDLTTSGKQQMVEKMRILQPLSPVFNWCEARAISGSAAVAPVCHALADLAESRGAPAVVTLHEHASF